MLSNLRRRFSVLIGPINHIKHLFSKERLPFTAAYFASLGLTLYFAVGVKSYIGSLVFAIIQVTVMIISFHFRCLMWRNSLGDSPRILHTGVFPWWGTDFTIWVTDGSAWSRELTSHMIVVL